MKEIPLTKGKVALVDDDDYEWAMQWKWQASGKVGKEYAMRTSGPRHGPRKGHYLHRELAARAGLDVSSEIDHADTVRLHNWRSNLRVATHADNLANRPATVKNSSGVKGVYWNKKNKKVACPAISSQRDGVFWVLYFFERRC